MRNKGQELKNQVQAAVDKKITWIKHSTKKADLRLTSGSYGSLDKRKLSLSPITKVFSNKLWNLKHLLIFISCHPAQNPYKKCPTMSTMALPSAGTRSSGVWPDVYPPCLTRRCCSTQPNPSGGGLAARMPTWNLWWTALSPVSASILTTTSTLRWCSCVVFGPPTEKVYGTYNDQPKN